MAQSLPKGISGAEEIIRQIRSVAKEPSDSLVINLGAPAESADASADGINTSLTITGDPEKTVGTMEFFYHRQPIDSIRQSLGYANFIVGDKTHTHEILPFLVEKTGIKLTAEDIVNEPLTVVDGNITITAANGYFFIPGTKTIVLADAARRFIDLPLTEDYSEKSGLVDIAFSGFPNNNTPEIATVNGKTGLRINGTSTIHISPKEGLPDFLSQDSWELNFEVALANPNAVRYDNIFIMRHSAEIDDYQLLVRRYWQNGNRGQQINTNWSRDPINGFFREADASAANIWKRFTIRKLVGNNMLQYYENGIWKQQQNMARMLTSDRLQINFNPGDANGFNGYLRNFYIFAH